MRVNIIFAFAALLKNWNFWIPTRTEKNFINANQIIYQRIPDPIIHKSAWNSINSNMIVNSPSSIYSRNRSFSRSFIFIPSSWPITGQPWKCLKRNYSPVGKWYITWMRAILLRILRISLNNSLYCLTPVLLTYGRAA